MKLPFVGVLGWMTVVTSVALGQPMPPAESSAVLGVPQVPAVEETSPDAGRPYYRERLGDWFRFQERLSSPGERFWMSADYLLWRVKNGPLPVPLVTTGPVTDPRPAVLGQPNTQVLFGGTDIDYGTFSGMRLGAGFWLDQEGRLGIEAGGFFLASRSSSFSARSDSAGNPVLSIAAFNPVAGNEGVYDDAFPGEVAGRNSITSSTRLWGWDVNGVYNAYRSRAFTADLLLGYRRLDLRENLQIHNDFAPLIDNRITFLGAPVAPPATLMDFDRFSAHNRFDGAQIGGRLAWRSDLLTLSLLGKLAFGVTRQQLTIDGGSVLNVGGTTTAVPGGIFAQQTNIGHYNGNDFTVIPELGVNLELRLTPRLSAQFGYTMLYWSHVVRPGNQIDRVVNPNIVPTDQDFGKAGGPPRPAPLFNASDFWAQGLNFGLNFRY